MEVRVNVIEKRLRNVKRIISVASGKGGVGKSLVASSLALNLSHKGFNIGLFDLDLYGPSLHIILGVKKQNFPEEEKGIIPPKIHGINFMSIIYFTKEVYYITNLIYWNIKCYFHNPNFFSIRSNLSSIEAIAAYKGVTILP